MLCVCARRGHMCVLRQLLCISNDPTFHPMHLHQAVQCYHMAARVNHTHSSHTVARTLPIADSPWVAQAARTSSPPRAKGEPSPLLPPTRLPCMGGHSLALDSVSREKEIGRHAPRRSPCSKHALHAPLKTPLNGCVWTPHSHRASIRVPVVHLACCARQVCVAMAC